MDIQSFSFSLDPEFGSPEPFDSTCIEQAGWVTGELEITFTDGTNYTYYEVSPLVYANFLRAISHGWFFNRYIRNRYSFTRNG